LGNRSEAGDPGGTLASVNEDDRRMWSMTSTTRTLLLNYGVAVLGTAVAVLLRWLLDPWLGDFLPYPTLYGAVAFAVWLGGSRPAVLAAVLGFLACQFLFVEPRGSFGLDNSRNLIGLFAYVFSCAIMIGFGEAMHTARRHTAAQQRRRELAVEEQGLLLQQLGDEKERLEMSLGSLEESESRYRTIGEALRQATEHLRIVTESMAAPVTRCSRDLKYLWVSRPYADWINRPTDQIVGRPILDIIGPEAFADLRPRFEQVLGGQVVRYEEKLQYRGLGSRWISAVYTPTRDAEGVPDGWVAVVIDVTERKRMEESLRASETRLAAELEAMTRLHALSTRLLAADDLKTALADILDNALVTVAADLGNIQLHNPKAGGLQIVVQRGFPQDWLDHFRLVRIDDGSACAHAMHSGERMIIEDVNRDPAYEPHRAVVAAAGYRAVQSTPIKCRSGTILGMLSTHFRAPHRPSERDERLLDLYARHAADLIERLRSDEALRQRAEEIEKLMDTVPLGVFIAHDPACRRITGNPAGYQMLRLPVGSNLSLTPPAGEGSPFTARRNGKPLPPDQLPMQYAAGHAVEVRDVEVEHAYPDGTTFTLFGSASPLFDLQGKVRGCVASFLDITERKRLEEELRQRVEQLAQADHRKDEFLATLAHELRNPLAPISNAVELIGRANGDSAMLEKARCMMERQVGQLVRLVDDLLDISRITQGKVQLRKERVELAAVVRDAIDAARPLIDAQAHELTVGLPHEPVLLDADPTRLEQVISNLLNNAAKYTKKGGHVWLTAERQAGEVIVSVRDTGIGIAAEHLAHIFEMFSQVSPALERSHGGLGIGLALVKGLVELHGGSIEARSNGPGLGSEFTVRLPSAEAAVPATPTLGDRPEEGRPGKKCRVLIADDLPDTVESLAMMLQLAGHEVQTAHDGLEAVQAAAVFHPDVVVLDIGMPRMNGYEAARHIREQPWGQKMVLVALTGWGQEEDRRRSLEAGFTHHLTKPIKPTALEQLLEALAETHQSVRKR
jgi:PAS domain S-box-containing protein